MPKETVEGLIAERNDPVAAIQNLAEIHEWITPRYV
jgi:hypothetical protein